MHRHSGRILLIACTLLLAAIGGARAVSDTDSQPLPLPAGVMAIFDKNETLDRFGLQFEVGNRGNGEIELKLVKGNWRAREELGAGELSREDLNVDFMAALDEEKVYADVRKILREIVRAVSAIEGVQSVEVTGSVATEDDKRAWAEFQVGLRRYEAGEFARALPYFQRASALGCPRAQRTLGYVYENGQGVEQDLEEGRYWYVKAAEEGEAEAYYNLGRMSSGNKKYDEALAYYQLAIKLKPELSMAYNNIGYLLNELRHYEKAIPFLRRAIELNPEYAGSYSNLGISFDNLGKQEESIKVYREALILNPRAADVRVNLGVTLIHQDRFEEAIVEFHRAIHLEPYWHQPYSGLGSIYYGRKEYRLAVTAYERLVKNRPDHPWGFKLLADTYAQQGEYGKASKAAAQALELAKAMPNYDVTATKQIEKEYRHYVAAAGASVSNG